MKRIEVFRAGLLKHQWAFRFIADNGEKVAQSETYRNKADAVESATKIKKGYAVAPIVFVEGE